MKTTSVFVSRTHTRSNTCVLRYILLFILPTVSQHLPNFTRLLHVRVRAVADRHFCVCSKNSQDLQATCQSIALSEGDIITTRKAAMTGSLSFTPSLSTILRFVLCAGKGGMRPALYHIYIYIYVCVCVCVCVCATTVVVSTDENCF